MSREISYGRRVTWSNLLLEAVKPVEDREYRKRCIEATARGKPLPVYRRKGVVELPENWPPLCWSHNLLPQDDSPEAILHWLSWAIRGVEECAKGRQRNGQSLKKSGLPKYGGTIFVDDARRIVGYLLNAGWPITSPELPDRRSTYEEAAYQLRRVENWVATKGEQDSPNRASHSIDYRYVNWFGDEHGFSENQAGCVKTLWKNWQRGTPDVGGRTVLAVAEISQERLDLVFRDHAAWGTMIVSGKTKGSYRLNAPAPPRKKTLRAAKTHG